MDLDDFLKKENFQHCLLMNAICYTYHKLYHKLTKEIENFRKKKKRFSISSDSCIISIVVQNPTMLQILKKCCLNKAMLFHNT